VQPDRGTDDLLEKDPLFEMHKTGRPTNSSQMDLKNIEIFFLKATKI